MLHPIYFGIMPENSFDGVDLFFIFHKLKYVHKYVLVPEFIHRL